MGLMRSKEINNFFMLLIFISPIAAQFYVPPRPDGLWYGEKRLVEPGRIQIEAFLDPVCPDSRDAWPPLRRAMELYGGHVDLVSHLFPLPYHEHAFTASRAIQIVNMEVNTSAAYHLLEAFFNNQEQFYGSKTINMSKASVIDRIIKFSSEALGNSFLDIIEGGFNDTSTDHSTRAGFKYGGMRGVYATPFFLVNGFLFAAPGSAQNDSQWKNVLESLLK